MVGVGRASQPQAQFFERMALLGERPGIDAPRLVELPTPPRVVTHRERDPAELHEGVEIVPTQLQHPFVMVASPQPEAHAEARPATHPVAKGEHARQDLADQTHGRSGE